MGRFMRTSERKRPHVTPFELRASEDERDRPFSFSDMLIKRRGDEADAANLKVSQRHHHRQDTFKTSRPSERRRIGHLPSIRREAYERREISTAFPHPPLASRLAFAIEPPYETKEHIHRKTVPDLLQHHKSLAIQASRLVNIPV